MCNGDSEKSLKIVVKPGTKQLEMKDVEHENRRKINS